MTDSSRTQGRLICLAAGALGLLFLLGVLNGSYLALAVPVAVGVFFVLGLAFWVGWTIATVQVDPDPAPDGPAPPSRDSGTSDPSA